MRTSILYSCGHLHTLDSISSNTKQDFAEWRLASNFARYVRTGNRIGTMLVHNLRVFKKNLIF